MGLFKKLFSILQGDSEEKDIENLSGTSNSQETNCSEEKELQAKKMAKKEEDKNSQKPICKQEEFYTNEIEDCNKKEVNLEELSLEELEKIQKKLFVDIQKARLREDKETEKEMYSEWRKVRSAFWIKQSEKKAEEEAAAKAKAEEEAAAKAKAEEEAAAKAKAKEEAAAKTKAEEEAANPTLIDSEIANQLTDGGKKKNVILPASVCEIAQWAFEDNKTLESIDMTSCNKLTIIGELAFAGCENLTNIIFPENIEEIGESAFSNCEALTSVDLSNCKKLDRIGASAFNWCPSLEEVLLPESLSAIGDSAFCSCKIENIDFSACKLLTKFPVGLFNECKSLEEVVWPPHLKEIGAGAFDHCESLRRVELPDSVEVLGKQIFQGCKLKSLSLPKNIKKLPVLTVALGAEAQIKSLDMSRCKKLKVLTAPITCSSKTIVFPVGVEEIEADVFKYNFKHGQFESIFLPPTIKEVELNNSADEANVYCYAPELENVKDIIEKCACLLVLPQYYDSYYDQAVAEGAEGYLDKIPEDKLYFYDE